MEAMNRAAAWRSIGWRLQDARNRLFARVGRPAVMLAVVAVAVALVAAGAMFRAEYRLRRLPDAGAHMASAVPVGPAPAAQAADARTRFLRILPDSDDIGEIRKNLHRLAEDNDIALAHVDYRSAPLAKSGFLRHEIAMQLSGDAQAIEMFAARALQAHAGLALSRVRVVRGTASGAAGLDVRLEWTLFARLTAVSGGAAERASVVGARGATP